MACNSHKNNTKIHPKPTCVLGFFYVKFARTSESIKHSMVRPEDYSFRFVTKVRAGDVTYTLETCSMPAGKQNATRLLACINGINLPYKIKHDK